LFAINSIMFMNCSIDLIYDFKGTSSRTSVNGVGPRD